MTLDALAFRIVDAKSTQKNFDWLTSLEIWVRPYATVMLDGKITGKPGDGQLVKPVS